MKAIIERVKNCTLFSEGKKYSHIDNGLLVLFGVKDTDTEDMVEHFAQKILKLRVFHDENGKLNNDVRTTKGEIMLVSNFTIYGRTKSNRPDFTHSAKPDKAEAIYLKLASTLAQTVPTKTGVFRTHMDIEMTAVGPGTYILEEEKEI